MTAELSKLIDNLNVNNIKKYNMQTIEDSLINGGTLKPIRRKLDIGEKLDIWPNRKGG